MTEFKYGREVHYSSDFEHVTNLAVNWANEVLIKQDIEIEIISSTVTSIIDIEGTRYMAYTFFKYKYI